MAMQRLWLTLALGFVTAWAVAAPVGTAITYQGELKVAGAPANAPHDFEFALFDVDVGGTALSMSSRGDVMVTAGLFTAELDFTDVPFVAAQQYWLEVRVREGASDGSYTPLLPRQKITAAPYALNARSVQAGGVDQSAIASGAVGSVQIANAAVGNSELAALSVTDDKIADATISAAKLAFTPGDITAVVAGSGLTGGGASGAVALAVNSSVIQSRVTGTCPVGEYLRGIAADGTVSCDSIAAFLGFVRITTVDNGQANSVGQYSSIAIANDGRPVISSWDNSAGTLKVAKCANSACRGATITTVDDPVNSVGAYSSLAIGSDGFPVISYFDGNTSALKVAKCTDESCTGAATVTFVDDPAGNGVGVDTSIAIGSDGLPVISYQDFTAGALKVAKCINAACTGATTLTTVDDPANNVGDHSSLAISSDGLPVISYFDSTAGTLKVAKCATPDCTGATSIAIVDDPANAVGQYTSIAIGSDGLPVISYRDFTARSLKVAKCTNAACTSAATITTVDDPANDVGAFTSMAIGTDGFPVISYHDESAGALKVAKCSNADCSGGALIRAVDEAINDVGSHTSIAVDSEGLPVISYADLTDGTLKVVKCATPSCQ